MHYPLSGHLALLVTLESPGLASRVACLARSVWSGLDEKTQGRSLGPFALPLVLGL